MSDTLKVYQMFFRDIIYQETDGIEAPIAYSTDVERLKRFAVEWAGKRAEAYRMFDLPEKLPKIARRDNLTWEAWDNDMHVAVSSDDYDSGFVIKPIKLI